MIAVATLMLAAVLTTPLYAETGAVQAPPGFRMQDYRAPVPDTVPGARTVELADVQRLIADGAVLLDVYGLRRFSIDAEGKWTPGEERQSLPGAAWVPSVGWGEIEPWAEAYLSHSLEVLTDGQRDRPIVIFCKVDCWLSWNTTKRIAALGYQNLNWFPGGTDLWSDSGLPLEPAQPVPVPPELVAGGLSRSD